MTPYGEQFIGPFLFPIDSKTCILTETEFKVVISQIELKLAYFYSHFHSTDDIRQYLLHSSSRCEVQYQNGCKFL